MDSHTRKTSPTQNLHGMPLACLLGYGESLFSQLRGPTPVLKAEDVCLVGVRSFEWAEAELLLNLGVRIYFMDEVRKRGLQEILNEARERVTRFTSRFGISIDLDSLDPSEVPGVGTPVAGGLHAIDLIQALHAFHNDPRLAALEIVEYNPHHDVNARTAKAVHDLACSILGDHDAHAGV
jgi:arginase